MTGEPESPARVEPPTPVAGYDHAEAPTPIEPAHPGGDRPEDQLERFEGAFEGIDPPFAFLDLDAVWANAADMLRRAGGIPIRVASRSVRCRAMLRRILALDRGFQGLLTFSLPETLFLWEQGFRNLVLANPSTDREWLEALARLTAAEPETAPVAMVDCAAHLDLIEAAARSAGTKAPVRVAIDVDAGLRMLGGAVAIGPKRSPVHSAEQAERLAREILRRPGVELVGLMAYEGQIAEVGDRVPGRPLMSLAIRAMQALSVRELRSRRAEIVARVSELAPLEFVNGGGTGSIALTAAERAITEVAAGSGFYAPAFLDHFRAFDVQPAAILVQPVVRRPPGGASTALDGALPPLFGEQGGEPAIGDRAYFRESEAGELCERFNSLQLLAGETVVDEVPTYRGEGKAFH